MDKSNIIVWEKWRDPLGSDDLEEKLEQIKTNIENDFDNEDDLQEKVLVKNIKEQYMLTPIGLIPLTENTLSSKIFNFWTGHTKFSVSKTIANIIENIEGVETLDVFTKYRFRISVGKAFKDSAVLRDINDSVFDHLVTKDSIKYEH